MGALLTSKWTNEEKYMNKQRKQKPLLDFKTKGEIESTYYDYECLVISST